jgi:peroxiredoxin (alkyl hydroperoxide reductase subunit C)
MQEVVVPNLIVGKPAPDFTTSVVMPDNSILEEFNLYDNIKGKNCTLMFYPLDFTFVCPSEIIALDNRRSEFEQRDCVVLTVSIDSHFSHLGWKNTSRNEGGIGPIQIPMLSDMNRTIAKQYNVLHDHAIALRGTFIIDRNFIVRHMLVNDFPIGRNADEVLRTLDAISHHEKYGDVCPAGWENGKQSMQPTLSGVKEYIRINKDTL